MKHIVKFWQNADVVNFYVTQFEIAVNFLGKVNIIKFNIDKIQKTIVIHPLPSVNATKNGYLMLVIFL